MQCPQCSSDNVQKLAAVYLNGTSDFVTSGTASFYDRQSGHHNHGSTYQTGVSQTKLAQLAAPPKKKKVALAILASFILVFGLVPLTAIIISTYANVFIPSAAIMLLSLVTFIVVVIWVVRRARSYNIETYPKLYASWTNTWFCHQCGSFLEVQI